MNKNRLLVFYGFLIIGTLVLVARLFELQIIFGSKNRALAEGNRIHKVINPAPRGMIYDREGKPLVRNVPVYRIRESEDQRIGGSEDKYRTISREEALKIEAQGGKELENLRMDIGRDYLYGQALAHLLGYLGEANKEEVELGEYRLGDLVGRMGIEEAYDSLLRGQDGGEIFEVDSQGHKVREIGEIEPVSGQDFQLSIDAELSRVAFEALEGRKGAVVATEAKTGQVLVLVSSPSFNPNQIDQAVLNDSDMPMFNRAIGGIYPPGSTFKIVTAAAGVEEKKVDGNTTYEDTGEIRIGEYVYRNWYFSQYGKTEGEINLVRAIKRSTDTFFYKMGEWVGATKLAEWAKVFGLGRETGIDIPGEAVGLVPSPEWKEKVKGEHWFLGNTYHFAIGQADLLATPLQINMMTAVIANGGQLCLPRVKRNISENTSDGGRLERSGSHDSSEVSSCQDLHLQEETLRLVKEGMREACFEGGTAPPFFDFEPRVACKTGTAEFGDPQNRTHAWLTAFAPTDDPEIVVTALVEAGGEGSDVAVPIVKKVMETWFKRG